MIRHIIIDPDEFILKSEYTYPGQDAQYLGDIPEGASYIRLMDTHEDFRAPVGERVIL